MNDLSTVNIISLTFRTYFIRIFYNYKNLFGEGMCYCLFPSLSGDKVRMRDDIVAEQIKLINTNEYLSGYAVGIMLRTSRDKNSDPEKTRKILSSVLGSIGDRLIYRLILPVIVLSALNKFAVTDFTFGHCTWIFVVFLLAAFNAFSFSLRFYGIKSGYKYGLESLKIFKTGTYHNINRLLAFFRNFLTVILTLNIIIYFFKHNI